MKLGTEIREQVPIPKGWDAIEALASKQDWNLLRRELILKLNDAELKQARMEIPINFEQLGFRILRLLAACNPRGTMKARFDWLDHQAAELLSYRHQILPLVRRCGERMQALLATNTSAAWAELASMLRRELNKPAWALEAAAVALKKEPTNLAGFAAKIAAHGDLGDFQSAHRTHRSAIRIHPSSSYVAAAIAKVELKEGKLRASLDNALNSFQTEPRAACARQIGNVFRAAGLPADAKFWFAQASSIESSRNVEMTSAHLNGLIKLARLHSSLG